MVWGVMIAMIVTMLGYFRKKQFYTALRQSIFDELVGSLNMLS